MEIALALASSLPFGLLLGTALFYALKGIWNVNSLKWWQVFLGVWFIHAIFQISINPKNFDDIKGYQGVFSILVILGIVGAVKTYRKRKTNLL